MNNRSAADPGAAWFLCPDAVLPYGGIRKIYRFVDVLNAAGSAAAVVHDSAGFQVDWFEHETATVGLKNVDLRAGDVVVVPDVWAGLIPLLDNAGVRTHLLCQNPYQMNLRHIRRAIRSSQFEGVSVVSEDSAQFFADRVGLSDVHRIRYAIDDALFRPAPKKLELAYMPRKLRAQASEVLAQLDRRGALAGWEVSEIDDVRETEAAGILRRASVFLSFAYMEGFGLPTAEAMACSCFVVGYHGRGGRELFDGDRAIGIDEADLLGFVEAAARVLTRWPGDFAARAEEGRRFVAKRYTAENEAADVRAGLGALIHPVSGERVQLDLRTARRVTRLPRDSRKARLKMHLRNLTRRG